jgi:hypothetical protein
MMTADYRKKLEHLSYLEYVTRSLLSTSNSHQHYMFPPTHFQSFEVHDARAAAFDDVINPPGCAHQHMGTLLLEVWDIQGWITVSLIQRDERIHPNMLKIYLALYACLLHSIDLITLVASQTNENTST